MARPLRIMTYNIHGGTGLDLKHDYKRIAAFLKEQEIDIALMQEVETRPPDRDTAQDIDDLCNGYYPHFIAAPAMHGLHGWYGNIVLSRHPIIDREIVDITVPGREPRNLIDAYIETPHGLLRVMNTHKGLKRAERHYQIERIHRELDENPQIPLVFGGDFNEWQSIFSVLHLLNKTLQRHPAGATWPSVCPLFHLDRLWCRPAGLITGVRRVITGETKIYSDHLPIMGEISRL